jgi:hypothetical protein
MELDEAGEGVSIWNEEAAVMYMTYGDNSWVSFDNNQTFQQKISFANDHCLGGVMIWAVDQDTYDWQALGALLDQSVDGASLLSGGTLSDKDTEELVTAYNAYTGTDCYVSDCVDWNTGQCKTGYSVLEYVHAGTYGTIKAPDTDLCTVGDSILSEDEDSQYRLVCCPTEAMPESCTWGGGDADGFCTGGGSDFCGDGKYELLQDSWVDRWGGAKCVVGARSLCCNSNEELELCSWTSCGPGCSDDLPSTAKYKAYWPGSSKCFPYPQKDTVNWYVPRGSDMLHRLESEIGRVSHCRRGYRTNLLVLLSRRRYVSTVQSPFLCQTFSNGKGIADHCHSSQILTRIANGWLMTIVLSRVRVTKFS